MQWFYLAALIAVIICLALIDRRYSLAFYFEKKRSFMTIAISVWLFIVWDIFGIKLGIFSHGGSIYTLPYRIIPEFPVEEIFFLIVLTYSALLIYRFVQTKAMK